MICNVAIIQQNSFCKGSDPLIEDVRSSAQNFFIKCKKKALTFSLRCDIILTGAYRLGISTVLVRFVRRIAKSIVLSQAG